MRHDELLSFPFIVKFSFCFLLFLAHTFYCNCLRKNIERTKLLKSNKNFTFFVELSICTAFDEIRFFFHPSNHHGWHAGRESHIKSCQIQQIFLPQVYFSDWVLCVCVICRWKKKICLLYLLNNFFYLGYFMYEHISIKLTLLLRQRHGFYLL